MQQQARVDSNETRIFIPFYQRGRHYQTTECATAFAVTEDFFFSLIYFFDFY